MSLKDKVVLVSEADTAVGDAVVGKFVRYGCRVAATGSDVARLEATARKYGVSQVTIIKSNAATGNTGGSSSDQQQQQNVHHVVDAVISKHGIIDIIIFCQPLVPSRSTEKTSRNELNDVWRRLVAQPLITVRRALPHLKESKGSVVFLTSLGTRKTDGVMCVTDAYRENATRLLAHELRPHNVKFNAISCYCAETQTTFSNWLYWSMFAAPLRQRDATPDDVAEHVAFVTSGRFDHVTGGGFYLDGALTMTCPVSNSFSTRLVSLAGYWMKVGQDKFWKLFGGR